jgi:ABC-2 type transport system permease protein
LGLISDTRYLFIRNIKKLIRTPILLFFSLFQPIIFMLLFTQLLGRFSSIPGFTEATGAASYAIFATAGILLQNAFGSALQSGTSIVADIDSGYLQKMLVTPVNRYAILLGRLLSDAFRVVIQSLIIIALSFLPFVGVNYATGVPGILLVLVVIAFFGLAWSGISLAIGMTTRSAETVTAMGGLITFPLLFLSTSLVPLSFQPQWIQTISMFNPISYAVNAVRVLIITGYDWSTILQAFGVIGLVGIITLSATVYQFRKVVK